MRFQHVWVMLLPAFMLLVTDVKEITSSRNTA
jgi:hypothetical protein